MRKIALPKSVCLCIYHVLDWKISARPDCHILLDNIPDTIFERDLKDFLRPFGKIRNFTMNTPYRGYKKGMIF